MKAFSQGKSWPGIQIGTMKSKINQNIQTEVDASYLYNKLAENESDDSIANVFRQMSLIERGHAEAFLKKKGLMSYPLLHSGRKH